MIKVVNILPKNIILSIVIIVVALYILYILFNKNKKKYESFANPCNDPNNTSCTNVPSNSYRNSCNNPLIIKDGNISTQCKKSDGKTYIQTSINSDCDNIIENCNGNLTCGKCPQPVQSCPFNKRRCPDGKCMTHCVN